MKGFEENPSQGERGATGRGRDTMKRAESLPPQENRRTHAQSCPARQALPLAPRKSVGERALPPDCSSSSIRFPPHFSFSQTRHGERTYFPLPPSFSPFRNLSSCRYHSCRNSPDTTGEPWKRKFLIVSPLFHLSSFLSKMHTSPTRWRVFSKAMQHLREP